MISVRGQDGLTITICIAIYVSPKIVKLCFVRAIYKQSCGHTIVTSLLTEPRGTRSFAGLRAMKRGLYTELSWRYAPGINSEHDYNVCSSRHVLRSVFSPVPPCTYWANSTAREGASCPAPVSIESKCRIGMTHCRKKGTD